ncbi:MAG: DUF6455 family protein [Pseudomonadota bacterium]
MPNHIRSHRPLGDLRSHLTLVRSMARAVGADVVKASEEGRLSQQDWADAVSRCRDCDHPQACRAWLLAVEWGAQTVPDGCRNTTLMQRLAQN